MRQSCEYAQVNAFCNNMSWRGNYLLKLAYLVQLNQLIGHLDCQLCYRGHEVIE